MTDAPTHTHEGYAPDEHRPLAGFGVVMALYAAVVAALGTAVRRGGGLPGRIGFGDLVLLSVATHKLSRLIAKDPVTSPLRAPFTQFGGTSGEAELAEEVRGRGLQKAVGELVTCPFCVGQWVATAFSFGLALAPKATRLVASIFVTLTASDYLQFAYARVEQSQS